MSFIIIADTVPAIFDIWLLGDTFLSSAFNTYLDIKQEMLKSNTEQEGASEHNPPLLFMQDYFNIKPCYSNFQSFRLASTRAINTLMEAVNQKNANLPRYLIVIMDKDFIPDMNLGVVMDRDENTLLLDWFMRQIHTIVRRKRIDLYDRKPGAISGVNTKIIFVKMLRRIGKFHNKSQIGTVCSYRAKFNGALNDAVAKMDLRILTISSCNSYDHFDSSGNLSAKGKRAFWLELDELLEKFNDNKIKLLPNPKNPPREKSVPAPHHQCYTIQRDNMERHRTHHPSQVQRCYNASY